MQVLLLLLLLLLILLLLLTRDRLCDHSWLASMVAERRARRMTKRPCFSSMCGDSAALGVAGDVDGEGAALERNLVVEGLTILTAMESTNREKINRAVRVVDGVGEGHLNSGGGGGLECYMSRSNTRGKRGATVGARQLHVVVGGDAVGEVGHGVEGVAVGAGTVDDNIVAKGLSHRERGGDVGEDGLHFVGGEAEAGAVEAAERVIPFCFSGSRSRIMLRRSGSRSRSGSRRRSRRRVAEP
jgi:hypothetical protein